jgi:uncharacterized lipoprotein YddW (UPF0748 family)
MMTCLQTLWHGWKTAGLTTYFHNYWSIDHKTASYAKLIKWWSENSTNTAIYIGNGSYKVNTDSDKKWNIPSEIPNQIDLTRTYKT